MAAQYVAPSITDNLDFAVSARHGTSVRTSPDVVVAVAPQTALFVGATSAGTADTNGNGLYDTLNISTTLNVLQSGHFEVRGTLVDSNGQTVAATSYSTMMANVAPLAVGNRTIVLPFDGKTIRESGKNDPYTLTNLSVHDTTTLYLEQATANNVYITTAYQARQFEGPLISVLSGSEQVLDTDSNGRYDRLNITVQMDVLRPGIYGWNGALEDSSGRLLGWASGSGMLDAQNPLHLSFPGLPIGLNGQAGPYNLTALSVYQISNIVNNYPATDGFYNVYHTAAYAANQFEQDPTCSVGATSLQQETTAAPRGLYMAFLPVITNSATSALAQGSERGFGATPPMAFIPNVGQTDKQVSYLVRGGGGTLFFSPDEAVLSLPHAPDTHGPGVPLPGSPATAKATSPRLLDGVVRLRYEGANPKPTISAAQQLPGVVNILSGADRTTWHTDIPTYGALVYQQVYPGVDVIYNGPMDRSSAPT